MKIFSETTLSHPVAKVFEAYRDRLPEVAAYLDDIAEIKVLDRVEEDGAVRLHNEWASDTEIPAVAQKILKPEHLRWDDHARWSEADMRCEWEIKTRAFTESVRCTGHTRLIESDGGAKTTIRLEGELNIELSDIPGLPKFLAKKMAPQVEKFIVNLVTPNLEKTNSAIGRFLDDQG